MKQDRAPYSTAASLNGPLPLLVATAGSCTVVVVMVSTDRKQFVHTAALPKEFIHLLVATAGSCEAPKKRDKRVKGKGVSFANPRFFKVTDADTESEKQQTKISTRQLQRFLL